MNDGVGGKNPHHGTPLGCLYQTPQIVFLKSYLVGFTCNQRNYPWGCQPSSGTAFMGNVGLGIHVVRQTLGAEASWVLLSCAGAGARRRLFHNSTPKKQAARGG